MGKDYLLFLSFTFSVLQNCIVCCLQFVLTGQHTQFCYSPKYLWHFSVPWKWHLSSIWPDSLSRQKLCLKFLCFFIRNHDGVIYFESTNYSKFLLLTAQHFLNLWIASWPTSSGGKLSERKRVKVPTGFTQSWPAVSWYELGCVAMAFVQLLLLTAVNYCINYCLKYWDIRAGADGLGSWEVFSTLSCIFASKIAPPLITSQSTAVLFGKYVTPQPEGGRGNI